MIDQWKVRLGTGTLAGVLAKISASEDAELRPWFFAIRSLKIQHCTRSGEFWGGGTNAARIIHHPISDPPLTTYPTMNQLRALVILVVCGNASSFAPSSSQARIGLKVAAFRKQVPAAQAPAIIVDARASSSAHAPSCYWRTAHLAAAPVEVIDPSYNLALGSLALGAVFGLPGSPLKSSLTAYLAGIPLTLFGLFLAFQTTTLRFTFDEKNFALVRSNGESSGENLVVGGENTWAYDKFVNYDLFPSRSFPILVYFKETQTPEENWNIGPGEQANSVEAIANGAGKKYIFVFCPILCILFLLLFFFLLLLLTGVFIVTCSAWTSPLFPCHCQY